MPMNGERQPKREPHDRTAMLRAHPFFKGLTPSIVDELAPRAVTRALRRGAVLFRKGDQGSSFYLLISGAVRIDAPSESGRGAILNLITPGEIFGEIAALDGSVRTADAVAVEPSELMVIDKREFIPVLRKYPELAVRFIEILCGRIRRTSEQVEDIVFLDLGGRLAKVLLFLHQKAAADPSQAKVRITQREISQIVGASRESTNKQLRQWERKKLLQIERGAVIVLRPEALADCIASE